MSEINKPRFDTALPEPYKEKWREAYRDGKDDSPRLSSYQAPGGKPLPFIYKSIEFSGGQSVDTAEYPFFGLWSNEALNCKAQTVTVHGYLRGEFYLTKRLFFLEALMVPTTDDSPGFFDHPLWGRFKVVVENYTVEESADKNGQCEISLTLKRAGVSPDARSGEIAFKDVMKPEKAAFTAANVFGDLFVKINADLRTMYQAFGLIKAQALNIAGTLQLPQNILDGIAGEVAGISNLIAQGVQSPMTLVQAFVNAALSVAAAVLSTGESAKEVGGYFKGLKQTAASIRKNNEKKALLNFLSAGAWELPIETATAREEETKETAENLYRTICLCAAALILTGTEDPVRGQVEGYWALYEKLENSVSLEDPGLYAAVTEMRAALAAHLRQSGIAREIIRTVERPVPLLYLVHYLGCDEGRLRSLNPIEDSFLTGGEICYA